MRNTTTPDANFVTVTDEAPTRTTMTHAHHHGMCMTNERNARACSGDTDLWLGESDEPALYLASPTTLRRANGTVNSAEPRQRPPARWVVD
jgi:hypothetical protein